MNFIKKIFSTKVRVQQRIFRLYFLMILIGTLLLLLPIAYNSSLGKLSFIDALFTSSSAFSDTGLSVKNTAEYFTLFGQIVILFLIQVGGIGFLALRVIIFIALGKKFTISDRVLISSERGSGKVGGVIKMIRFVIIFILILELILAVALGINFYFRYFNNPDYPFKGNFGTLIWHSIFHSISAVNNAGFDIIGSNSLAIYSKDYFVQTVMIIGLIIGGLGFPFLYDFKCYLDAKRKKENFRFSLFSKITIKVYFLVSLVGIILISWIELTNPQSFLFNSIYSLPEKIFYILFHTFSARNAGFTTFSIHNFSNGSKIVLGILGWIGASPSSTGGGIRTTTFFLVLLAIFATIKGHSEYHYKDRQIERKTVERALVVTITSIFLLLVATIIITSTTNIPFNLALFESTSAYGTTGISLGVTKELKVFGKLAIIALMFIGQLGISMTLLSFTKSNVSSNKTHYPEEDLMIS